MSAAGRPLEMPSFRTVGPGGLPIFRFDREDAAVFYVPGIHPATVLSASEGDRLEHALAGAPASPADGASAARLKELARRVAADASARLHRRFDPECLTILATNACNLRCGYCHTSAGSTPVRVIPLAAVRRGAELVAVNCVRKDLPLTTVFHGGGEPTLFFGLMQACLDAVRAVAAIHGLRTFTYTTTNGLMPEEVARAMAHRFDLVGISCDGPEDIQGRQRPAFSGQATNAALERNAAILRDEGCAVSIRATVTELAAERLLELVDYFADHFHPVRIVFEPLYRRGFALRGSLQPPSPDTFVRHLLQARRHAMSKGIPVEFPDSCVDEIHGRFCHVVRDVLSITPDGRLTACFDATEWTGPASSPFFIGSFDEVDGVPRLDRDRVETLRADLAQFPETCSSCFNRCHCARGCPEICPLRADESPAGTPRCRTALLWSYCRIMEVCGIRVA